MCGFRRASRSERPWRASSSNLSTTITSQISGSLCGPSSSDPFYDQGSQYTVPYVVYQTGIGWRNDLVDAADIEGLANPWDVFWNPKYKGITGLYDDFRETMQMAMFRAGIAEPREATPDQVAAAADSLIELVDLMDILYTIDGAYQGIPEGRFGLHLAWSGDMVNSQYYFPEGGDPASPRLPVAGPVYRDRRYRG